MTFANSFFESFSIIYTISLKERVN
jgi:hypothetical protein